MKNQTNHIGLQISRQRRDAGLTQQQVAERLGVHFVTISRWEVGVIEPKINDLAKLNELFGWEFETHSIINQVKTKN